MTFRSLTGGLNSITQSPIWITPAGARRGCCSWSIVGAGMAQFHPRIHERADHALESGPRRGLRFHAAVAARSTAWCCLPASSSAELVVLRTDLQWPIIVAIAAIIALVYGSGGGRDPPRVCGSMPGSIMCATCSCCWRAASLAALVTSAAGRAGAAARPPHRTRQCPDRGNASPARRHHRYRGHDTAHVASRHAAAGSRVAVRLFAAARDRGRALRRSALRRVVGDRAAARAEPGCAISICCSCRSCSPRCATASTAPAPRLR